MILDLSRFPFHFVCPSCGWTYFGSELREDGTTIRHCHGIGCKFSWKESDDEKHAYVSFMFLEKLVREFCQKTS